MDWDNLKVALAISRLGSLTQAAHALGIDQSTAGRRLSVLEGDLGVILFVRSKTGFALTDAGEAAINQAIEVERRIDRLRDAVAPPDEGPVGAVRLVGNAWTLDRLAATVMAPFLAAHPRLDLRIVTLRTNARPRGEATLSLWFEVEPRESEFAIKLGEVPYAVYCARGSDPAQQGWITFFDEDATRPAIARAHKRLQARDEGLGLVHPRAEGEGVTEDQDAAHARRQRGVRVGAAQPVAVQRHVEVERARLLFDQAVRPRAVVEQARAHLRDAERERHPGGDEEQALSDHAGAGRDGTREIANTPTT